MRGKTKKNTELYQDTNVKELYDNITNSLNDIIGTNLYSEHAQYSSIAILCEEEPIMNLDTEEYDFDEIMKKIKKVLIKNNLFISAYSVEDEELVIHTTANIWGLLYIPEQLEEMMQEIENENLDNKMEEINMNTEKSNMNELFTEEEMNQILGVFNGSLYMSIISPKSYITGTLEVHNELYPNSISEEILNKVRNSTDEQSSELLQQINKFWGYEEIR